VKDGVQLIVVACWCHNAGAITGALTTSRSGKTRD